MKDGKENQTDREDLDKDFSSVPGVGVVLKRGREKKGLDIQQLSETTKLRPHYIEAIEREEWEKLPSKAFVTGFIRSYARAAGLDEERMVALYNESAPGEASPLKPLYRKKEKKRGVLYFLLIVLVVLGFCFYLFQDELPWKESPAPVVTEPEVVPTPAPEKKKIREKTPDPVEQPPSETDSISGKTQPAVEEKDEAVPVAAESDSAPVAIDAEAPLPEEQQASSGLKEEAVAADRLVLSAKVRERTWVKITIDGSETREFIFPGGSNPSWEAQEGFELLIGNAGGLDLELNGEEIRNLGNQGQVVRLILPEEYKRREKEE